MSYFLDIRESENSAAARQLYLKLPWKVVQFVVANGIEAQEDLSKIAPITAAIMRVLLQAVHLGYPLEFPPEVLAVYLKGCPETPLFECRECGYGLPRTFTGCPVCGGGVVGEGLHSKRMALKAYFN